MPSCSVSGTGRRRGERVEFAWLLEDLVNVSPANADLLRAFERRFDAGPATVMCKAPGHVNLLGEHVDYNGLPVLMTVNGRLRWSRARPDGHVRIQNAVLPGGRIPQCAELAALRQGSWINYCKSAIEGVNSHYNVESFPGMDLLFEVRYRKPRGCRPPRFVAAAWSTSAFSVNPSTPKRGAWSCFSHMPAVRRRPRRRNGPGHHLAQ